MIYKGTLRGLFSLKCKELIRFCADIGSTNLQGVTFPAPLKEDIVLKGKTGTCYTHIKLQLLSFLFRQIRGNVVEY